jgi:hypothetical protein
MFVTPTLYHSVPSSLFGRSFDLDRNMLPGQIEYFLVKNVHGLTFCLVDPLIQSEPLRRVHCKKTQRANQSGESFQLDGDTLDGGNGPKGIKHGRVRWALLISGCAIPVLTCCVIVVNGYLQRIAGG